MTDLEINGWDKWAKFVLKELERLNTCYNGLLRESQDIRVEIAKLKVKAGIWGAVGGAIPVAIGLGLWLIKALGEASRLGVWE